MKKFGLFSAFAFVPTALLSSTSAFAAPTGSGSTVVSAGPTTITMMKKEFPEGSFQGAGCQYTVAYGANNEVTVSIVPRRSGALGASCKLSAQDANLQAETIPGDTTVMYGNSKYVEGGPDSDRVGCRVAKSDWSLTVVNFGGSLDLCQLK